MELGKKSIVETSHWGEKIHIIQDYLDFEREVVVTRGGEGGEGGKGGEGGGCIRATQIYSGETVQFNYEHNPTPCQDEIIDGSDPASMTEINQLLTDNKIELGKIANTENFFANIEFNTDVQESLPGSTLNSTPPISPQHRKEVAGDTTKGSDKQ